MPVGAPLLFRDPQLSDRGAVPRAVLRNLPSGQGRTVAHTIDDGSDTSVLLAYCELARRTGLRLTFFVTGQLRGWTEAADVIRPLVESGQVYLGNHSWSHPAFTTLSSSGIAREIKRNERFLINTFGVTGRPFCRPPFGAYDGRVQAVLADLGYPGLALWSGSLGDATSVTKDFIREQSDRYFTERTIMLGHANHPSVNGVMGLFPQLLQERDLIPVTLADVYDVGRAPVPTWSVSPEPSGSPLSSEAPGSDGYGVPSPLPSSTPSKTKTSKARPSATTTMR